MTTSDKISDEETPSEDTSEGDNSVENTVTTETRAQMDGRPLRRWIWTVIAFSVFAISVTGMVVRMPYVAFLPGAAFETEQRLELVCEEEAKCLDSFPSDGEVLFTTVSVRTEPSFWEYLWLRNDSDVEIDDIEEVLGDRSPQENDQFNAELMTASKDVAVAVALQKLGYEAITSEALFVAATIEDTAAEGVLQRGDRLVAIDGQELISVDDLFESLSDVEPNSEIELVYARMVDDRELVSEVTLELGPNPDDPSKPFIGIQPVPRFDYTEFEFGVEIDSADVGGPSAGLAFTLATLDYLTEGDLTGGGKVAVTGTISPTGAVGPIGGVLQKAVDVRRQGIELFLVPGSLPAEELAQLEELSGPDLKIVPVDTLEEALVALEDNGGDVQPIRDFDSGDL